MNLVMSLEGTVESVLCFPSRCGNPRCERISISGVSFHKASVSFFFAPFSFFVPIPSFPQKNSASGATRNDDRQLGRPIAFPFSGAHGLIPCRFFSY